MGDWVGTGDGGGVVSGGDFASLSTASFDLIGG